MHCGPDGIYVSALGDADGNGPGGIFLMDHETFDVLGRWEIDRGPQELAYDFWWHLGHDTMVTSEWGTPDMVEDGLIPELLLGGRYGHRLHFWDLRKRRARAGASTSAPSTRWCFELRPAHDPTKAYGFVGVVICLEDLSASIWLWYRDGDQWAVKKVIAIPAEPAEPDQLPPMLKGFKAVPPLVTDIDLSVDDKFLYVSCWGTGEFQQYDVSDPFNPKLTGKLRHRRHRRTRRAPEAATGRSTAGRRWWRSAATAGASTSPTRSTALGRPVLSRRHRGLDGQARRQAGGRHRVRRDFFLSWPEGHLPHQVRLQGGDASSDSYCYP